MPAPRPNGHVPEKDNAPEPQPERWGIAEVIAETEALRALLQEASTRTSRLLAALKQQRRQSWTWELEREIGQEAEASHLAKWNRENIQ